MNESENNVIEEQIGNKEENLTLAQEIARLTTAFALPSPGPTPTGKKTYLPINPHGVEEIQTICCGFCGAPRLDPDPTGVTCGEPKCLLELGKWWTKEGKIRDTIDEVLSNLKEVAAMLEIDSKTLPDDAEKICDRIKEKVEPMESALQLLKEVAQSLGLDELHIGDTTEDISDQIKEIVDNLRTELISAAESLGLNPATLPENMNELCQIVTKESLAVKEAVEKLKEQREKQNKKTDQ